MSTELQVTSADTLHTKMEYAKALAASSLLPQSYAKQPANVLVAIEYGEALGLAPMVAIQQIAVIQGKPTMSAQLMGALVRQAGHRLRVSVDESSKSVIAELTRSDDPDFTFRSVWDMARAQTAGLTGKGGSWKNFPLAMLKARAITEVCRDGCPEVLAGVAYTPDELEPTGRPVAAPTVDTAHLMSAVTTTAGSLDGSGYGLGHVDTDTGEVLDAEVLDPEEL